MHSRDGRGRRCIHTVIPYIHTRYTRGVDSYSTDPRIGDKKNKCTLDRFPVTYTRRGPSGSVVGHDTHTRHTYSSLFHFICIYCPRTKYILQTRTPKRARPRHGWQSIARACIHSSTRRPATETGDDRATTRRAKRTNERVVVVVVSDETRPRVVHARVSSVSGKSIHWPSA